MAKWHKEVISSLCQRRDTINRHSGEEIFAKQPNLAAAESAHCYVCSTPGNKDTIYYTEDENQSATIRAKHHIILFFWLVLFFVLAYLDDQTSRSLFQPQ